MKTLQARQLRIGTLQNAIRLAIVAPGLGLALAGVAAAEGPTPVDLAKPMRIDALAALAGSPHRVVPLNANRNRNNSPSSVFVVTNVLDDGSPGTLRAAIAASNASFGTRDTIVFDPGIGSGPIFLADTLQVTDSVDIVGPAGRITVQGPLGNAPAFGQRFRAPQGGSADILARVFEIGDGIPELDSAVTMENLIVSGGVTIDYQDPVPGPSGSAVVTAVSLGAGIYSSESLTLRNVEVSGNFAGAVNALSAGSAIMIRGAELSLIDSRVTQNECNSIPSLAGPIAGRGPAPTGRAYAFGALVSLPTLPPAPEAPMGVGVYGTVTLDNTVVDNNLSVAYSLENVGAISMISAANVAYGSLSVRDSTISGNVTLANPGADPVVLLAVATGTGFFANNSFRHEIIDSRISNNQGIATSLQVAQAVATLSLNATLIDIQRSEIADNTLSASATIDIPNANGNIYAVAAAGGSAMVAQGNLSISDSTISGNLALAVLSAAVDASASDIDSDFTTQVLAPMLAPNYSARITNSTVSGNGTSSVETVDVTLGGAFNLTGTATSVGLGGGLVVPATVPGPAPAGGSGLPIYRGEVLNSTIAGNVLSVQQQINYIGSTTGTGTLTEAFQAGGGGLVFMTNGGLLASSIVDGNAVVGTGPTTGPDIQAPGLALAANNLVTDMLGSSLVDGANGNVEAPAELMPLKNNGGPTRTHQVSSTSPAIDAGFNPMGLSTDQRGQFSREMGLAADIGAFECGAQELIPETLLRDGFDPDCE